jgi:hypothetical protein
MAKKNALSQKKQERYKQPVTEEILTQRDRYIWTLSNKDAAAKTGMTPAQVHSRKNAIKTLLATGKTLLSKGKVSTKANATKPEALMPDLSERFVLEIDGKLFSTKVSPSKVEIKNGNVHFGDSSSGAFQFINEGKMVEMSTAPGKITVEGSSTSFD